MRPPPPPRPKLSAMSLGYEPYDPEPFGQRGARHMFRPVLIGICGVLVAIAAAMHVRSQRYYDGLWRVADGRLIQVGSAMGRLVVSTRSTNRPAPLGGEGWNYETSEIGDIADGWEPGLLKTLGVQWGQETFSGWNGRQFTLWRLRLRWRSVLFVGMTPLIADALLKRRARKRAERPRPITAEPYAPAEPPPAAAAPIRSSPLM